MSNVAMSCPVHGTHDLASYGSLPFREQIAYFLRKSNVPTQAWTDLWQADHDTGFMVAGASEASLLQDLREAVQAAIVDGESIGQFRKRFDAIVERYGWAHKGGRNWRTRVIYQTNLRTSYAAGRWAQLTSAAGRKAFPYWAYRHSMLDKVPRILHITPAPAGWNGLVLRADDPWWLTHFPPNGWGCFPGDTAVRCNAKLGLKGWYAGEVVELNTAFGNRVTLTVNHPVLTGRGWLPAGAVQEGDDIISASGHVDSAVAGVVDDEKPPTRTDDLFQALALEGLRVVPMSSHDFDGDALFMKRKIDVAGSNSSLMNVLKTPARELGGEVRLSPRLCRCIEAADAAFGTSLTYPMLADSVFFEDVAHHPLGDTQSLGDGARTCEGVAIQGQHSPLGVGVAGIGDLPSASKLSFGAPRNGLDVLPVEAFGGRNSTQIDTLQPHGPSQRPATAASLFRQLL
ncbi:MAG: hypothetical protein KGL35_32060, partial [Bradyrhizobium sp.]|nr:hypothetical protein [Bradyrhizobium sp.]